MREGNCYLSLAVPLGPYKPSLRVRQRLEDVASELGMRDGRGYEIPAVQVRAAII
jgi:hypothetical protein